MFPDTMICQHQQTVARFNLWNTEKIVHFLPQWKHWSRTLTKSKPFTHKEIPDNSLLDRVISRKCSGSFLLQTMEEIPQRSKIEIWILLRYPLPNRCSPPFQRLLYFANANATHHSQALKKRQTKLSNN